MNFMDASVILGSIGFVLNVLHFQIMARVFWVLAGVLFALALYRFFRTAPSDPHPKDR